MTNNHLMGRGQGHVTRFKFCDPMISLERLYGVLLCINQYTIFEVSSFTNYKDMIGGRLSP